MISDDDACDLLRVLLDRFCMEMFFPTEEPTAQVY